MKLTAANVSGTLSRGGMTIAKSSSTRVRGYRVYSQGVSTTTNLITNRTYVSYHGDKFDRSEEEGERRYVALARAERILRECGFGTSREGAYLYVDTAPEETS